MSGVADRSGDADDDRPSSDWLRSLRRYFAFSVPAHLAWEFAHMPLYTIWNDGSAAEIAFAALHCTGGDLLIATSALTIALLLVGSDWPLSESARRKVLIIAVTIGAGYTIFSEWLNIVIRQAWAYSDLMPVIPFIDTGLSPMAQWLVIPVIGLWWATRPAERSITVDVKAGSLAK